MTLNKEYQQRFGRLVERKDSRISLTKAPRVIAECKTAQSNFRGTVQNFSSEGIFIQTQIPSPIGQEIAVTFTLPKTKQSIKATGVVVRRTLSGIGVNIKVIFRD
jgi:hypothetical protein